jgi:hypothetical protein
MGIVNKLGARVEVTLRVKPANRRPTAVRSAALVAAEPKPARYASKKVKA